VWGYLARYYNLAGNFAAARGCCEQGLSAMRPEDRLFVALFLGVELELAVADAGLGRVDVARARLDELNTLHAQSDNPLTHGRIHEAYARTAAVSGDWPDFRHHSDQARVWFQRSGTPALVALGEQLRALEPAPSVQLPAAATAKHGAATKAGRRRAPPQPSQALSRQADEPSEIDEDALTDLKSRDES
jgi:hypothetical protein